MAKTTKVKKKQVVVQVAGLKSALKPRITAAEKAVALGKKAVKDSRKATQLKPKDPTTWRSLLHNQKTLAKAEQALRGLKQSQKLANDLCPFQIMGTFYSYNFVL